MSGRIAVVGIGNMGLAMALRLRDRGFAVAVRDIDATREALARDGGCTVAASPAAAASAAPSACPKTGTSFPSSIRLS